MTTKYDVLTTKFKKFFDSVRSNEHYFSKEGGKDHLYWRGLLRRCEKSIATGQTLIVKLRCDDESDVCADGADPLVEPEPEVYDGPLEIMEFLPEPEEELELEPEKKLIPTYHQCLKCQDLWEYCSCQYENDEVFALLSDPEVLKFKLALIEEEDWSQLFPEEEPYEYTITSEVLGPVHEWGLPGGMQRRGRSKKRGRGRGKRRGAGTPRMVINRSPFWAPARLRTHLKFDLRFTAPSATIASPWSLEYIVLTNPNNFTGASTAVSGYASLAAMYRKNRVIKGHLIFSCQNNDAFGIEMFATPVNFLPSLITDPTRFLNMQNSRRRLISPKGGIDHGTVKATASIAQFGGSASTAVEDNYVGTTDNTSPPSDNLYFLYGHLTNGVATVVPALNVITVFVEIDFFELQSPAT